MDLEEILNSDPFKTFNFIVDRLKKTKDNKMPIETEKTITSAGINGNLTLSGRTKNFCYDIKKIDWECSAQGRFQLEFGAMVGSIFGGLETGSFTKYWNWYTPLEMVEVVDILIKGDYMKIDDFLHTLIVKQVQKNTEKLKEYYENTN